MINLPNMTPAQRNEIVRRSDIPKMDEAETLARLRKQINEAETASGGAAVNAARTAHGKAQRAFEETEARFFIGEAAEEELQRRTKAAYKDDGEEEFARRMAEMREEYERKVCGGGFPGTDPKNIPFCQARR